jgi:hypothetical protein
MYASLLIVHSWLRWLALAALIIVVVRALRGVTTGAPWHASDPKWMAGAAHLLTLQLGVGALLYGVSPYIRSLLGDMGGAMADRVSRLFVVEHAAMMLLALGATHMGAAIARRAPTDAARHARAAAFFGVALLIVLYAIPWMRPLLRMGL